MWELILVRADKNDPFYTHTHTHKHTHRGRVQALRGNKMATQLVTCHPDPILVINSLIYFFAVWVWGLSSCPKWIKRTIYPSVLCVLAPISLITSAKEVVFFLLLVCLHISQTSYHIFDEIRLKIAKKQENIFDESRNILLFLFPLWCIKKETNNTVIHGCSKIYMHRCKSILRLYLHILYRVAVGMEVIPAGWRETGLAPTVRRSITWLTHRDPSRSRSHLQAI